MSRLFIVSEYVNPSENSTGYYWHAIIRHFSGLVPRLSVICPMQSHYRADLVLANPELGKTPAAIFVDIENLDLLLVRSSGTHGKGISRLIAQIKLSTRLFCSLVVQAKRGDIVFCGTNPVFSLVIMACLRRLRGFRWVLLVHDVFPENLVPAGYLRSRGVLYSSLKILFDWAYRQADGSVAIGRDMRALLAEKIRSPDRVFFAPNWVDTKLIYPMDAARLSLVHRFGWHDKIIFQFFGNIGSVQGVDGLLDAIRLTTASNAAFLFVGGGTKAELVKDFISANPTIPIQYMGPVPLSRNNEILSSCHVAIVALEVGMLGLGVPSKAYFSLAADRPLLVVAEALSEPARMVDEDALGWHCEPGNPAKLAALIDEICSGDISVFAARCRDVCLAKYSGQSSLNTLASVVLGSP